MCSTEKGIQNCPVKCPKDLTKKVFVKDKQNKRLLFTLGRPGEELYRDATPGDLLSSYNPFFDPCLKNYFQRKGIRDTLLKSNLLTEKGDILCSLKDYNEYRQSLHRVHADHVRAKLNAEDEKEMLQKRLDMSDAVFKRIENKNKKFAETYGDVNQGGKKCLKVYPVKYENLVRNLKGKKLERECQQRKKFINDIKKYNERLLLISQMNHLRKNELLERGLYRKMEMIKKQIYVIEKQRERESKFSKKICTRFEGYEKRKKVYDRPVPETVVIKCPHLE